jgi:hypothetical protein
MEGFFSNLDIWQDSLNKWSARCKVYLYRTAQHRKTRTNIHALSGIRTHESTIQDQGPRSRPRGHWDLLWFGARTAKIGVSRRKSAYIVLLQRNFIYVPAIVPLDGAITVSHSGTRASKRQNWTATACKWMCRLLSLWYCYSAEGHESGTILQSLAECLMILGSVTEH